MDFSLGEYVQCVGPSFNNIESSYVKPDPYTYLYILSQTFCDVNYKNIGDVFDPLIGTEY